MKVQHWIIVWAILFQSCTSDNENINRDVIENFDSIIQRRIGEVEQIDTSIINQVDSSELEEDPFYHFIRNDRFQKVSINCNKPCTIEKTLDENILLSHLYCSMDRAKTTKLLRQILIAARYRHARSLDSLRFLSNSDLLQMISTVYHQDIPSELLEADPRTFREAIEKLRVMMQKEPSKRNIYAFINDSIFHFVWMHYSITKVIDGIIELDYNGGGMAGSAEKKYYALQNGQYAHIDLENIASKIDIIMTKEVKENASVNIGRFPITFTKDIKNDVYELKLIIDTYSSASCCPPYVARCKTKDFRTIIPGTLAYATTDHLDNPSIQPKWKTIR